MRHSCLKSFVGPIAALLSSTATAHAALMGVTTTGDVYSINQTNGAATLIGSNAGSSFHALAKSSSGTYYANDWGNAFQFLSLTTINPATGAKGGNVNSGNLVDQDWAFSPSGVLYGIQDNSGADQLVTINTTTGVPTTIGSRVNAYDGGMAFVGNTLYASAAGIGLATVNLSTGAATDVNPAEGGSWQGMTYDGGVLYGVSGSALYSINPSTGASALIGSSTISGNYHGLAVIPEPSSLGLLAAGGLMTLRRRRRSA